MAGSSSTARSRKPSILWEFIFRFPSVFFALLTSCLRLLSAGYSVTSPGLGRARVCVAGGPGIWDAIPPRDDVADKFEDALLRLKMESFFECLALCASFIIRGDINFAQVKGEIWERVRGIQALGSDLLGQRLTDLVTDFEETSDALSERAAREVSARALRAGEGKRIALERHLRNLAEPH